MNKYGSLHDLSCDCHCALRAAHVIPNVSFCVTVTLLTVSIKRLDSFEILMALTRAIPFISASSYTLGGSTCMGQFAETRQCPAARLSPMLLFTIREWLAI